MKIIDTKNDPDFGELYRYEHLNEPPSGHKGKLFLNLSEYANIDYNRMDDEICVLLAKTDLTKYPIVSGLMPPKLKYGNFEGDIMFDYNGNREILSQFDHMQKRKYLFFKHKTLLPWFFVLDLKPNTFFGRDIDSGPWSSIIEQLPYTKQCIESLPFEQIGRVVIYGSWPEASVPCHRDWIPDGVFHHHINLNPGGYRPVYIYDPTTDTKHYLPEDHKLYAYQTTDYHGVDPLPHFSYTIRVDGVYNQYVNFC